MARTLITSALPYINGIKHLGNLVGSMLPADVYARFMRARGNEVMFICATDEHGTPAELAAIAAGQDVATYCAEQHEIQKDIYKRFGLSFDHFGRSSSQQNYELTQHFAAMLNANGLIEERTIQQIYSIDDGRYLPDRYVEGTCPHCGYERARGDQCENCTKLLDPTDLINPRSAVSGSTNLEVRDTRHLFLKLDNPEVEAKIQSWIDSKEKDWPVLVTSIAQKWLKEGLRDRCITRDLAWGVPVGRPGYEGKVYYVWFDAPIEYIAATKEWADAAPEEKRDWKRWWFEADDVRYTEFMAKDNIPFHTVSFPATIMGSGEAWKLVDYIKGFNWLTWYGGKFSTSQRRGIFTDQALAEFPADYWRYVLIANAPETDDSSFTLEGFAGQVNKDLADVLGNFVNRTLKFTQSKFGDAVPAGGDYGPAEEALAKALDERIKALTENLEAIQYRKALAELRAIWVLGNQYLADEAPWTALKTDPERAAAITRCAFSLIRLFAILSAPVIPTLAGKMLAALGLPENQPWPTESTGDLIRAIPAGHAFTLPDVLVAKIDDARVAELTEKYGGKA
ncbi:methionine--tRNA ligase [Radicibacter daui]|uniref:methionine--tRNA ligase n=1 Tax=Radicibacter daui TaxID=3064829 RepID=UPI0040469348